MRRYSLLTRIARLERERGLSSELRSSIAYMRRYEAAHAAYEAERDRIIGLLPSGWRLVTDLFVDGDGFVVAGRHRATTQPAEIENGVGISVETKQVIFVNVQNLGLCHTRPPCGEDARWQAEYDAALPDNLRSAIRALKIVTFIDFINREPF